MGPISPGRWHVWQFLCKTGRTSRLNVTDEVSAARAAVARSELANTYRSIKGVLGLRITRAARGLQGLRLRVVVKFEKSGYFETMRRKRYVA
jgi:hypothetical protein